MSRRLRCALDGHVIRVPTRDSWYTRRSHIIYFFSRTIPIVLFETELIIICIVVVDGQRCRPTVDIVLEYSVLFSKDFRKQTRFPSKHNANKLTMMQNGCRNKGPSGRELKDAISLDFYRVFS